MKAVFWKTSILLVLSVMQAQTAGQAPAPVNMVWILPGTFTMGSPDDEALRSSWEGPQTQVTISQGFWIGKHEVTQGEYSSVMDGNPSQHQSNPDLPVERVSYEDVNSYCARLTQQDTEAGRILPGWFYRLPTEAEWEYACRAGTSTAFHYGQALRSGDANSDGRSEYDSSIGEISNPSGIFLRTTAPVGNYLPNAWGLYDMHGNVWEWCQDWWSERLPGGSVIDPQGEQTGQFRIARGGSFGDGAAGCRSALRDSHFRPNEGYDVVGFRVVLDPSPESQTAPTILVSPVSRFAAQGNEVAFSVVATGAEPLIFQWLKNGVAVSGATGSILTLNSVLPSDDGAYSVLARNAHGSVISDAAYLAVLAVDTTVQPAPRNVPPVPPQEATKDSLIVIVHGWLPKDTILTQPANVPWVDDMVAAISNRVADTWQVTSLKWIPYAWTTIPDETLPSAKVIGHDYGLILAARHWSHVHLIAHSAGARLIQEAAKALKENSETTTVHTTFLDAYVGADESGRDDYGYLSDYAENYFAHDRWTGFLGSPLWYLLQKLPTTLTEGFISNALNVDVTRLDPEGFSIPAYCSSTADEFSTAALVVPCCGEAWARRGLGEGHQWPHIWYYDTITNILTAGHGSYGFGLSKEAGGWEDHIYRVGNLDPITLGGERCRSSQNLIQLWTHPAFDIPVGRYQTSPNGVTGPNGRGFSLSAVTLSPSEPKAFGQALGTYEPTWFAMAIGVTDAVNLISFETTFSSDPSGQGLLTVYLNTNEIGFVDERDSRSNLRTHRFVLPVTITNGLYALGFRLDSFTNTISSIAVTNIATGYVGNRAEISLHMSRLSTNGTPVIGLRGPAGYNYLVESSTNLMDWMPVAALVNSNGTAFFIDSASTNAPQTFYRASFP